MNKVGKFLALVGAITGVAYLTKIMTNKPNLEARSSPGLRKEDRAKVAKEGKLTDPNKDSSSSLKNTHNNNRDESDQTSSYSDQRTQKMYKELGMTDDQKRRYEADYRRVMDSWDEKNPNVQIDEKMKVDEHNSALNAVLNEAQFSIYREWAKKNPN